MNINGLEIVGSIALKNPNLMSLFAEFQGQVFEHRQTSISTIQFDHTGKEYFIYPVIPKFSAPAPDFPALDAAFPRILVDLVIDVKLPEFKADGKEVVNGVTCDVLVYEAKNPGEPSARLWIDTLGRLAKSYMRTDSPQGSEIVTIVYTGYTQQPPDSRFSPKIPYGFVSANNSPSARPLGVGFPAPLGIWVDQSGKNVDVSRAAKGKRTVILFTAPECLPSQRALPVFNKLATALKGVDATLYEVSVGSNKPAGSRSWMRFWDKSAEIEKAFGVPVTPYLFVLDEEGTIIRGWAGYGPDQDKRLIQQIVSAFEEF